MSVQCPSCGNIEFQLRLITNLELADEVLTEMDMKKSYSCVVCDYTIGEVDDLEMLTITVYIVGDSMSGRRQGLSRIKDLDIDRAGVLDVLAANGCYRYNDDPKSPWVFTRSAWKRFDADPAQRLADKQHGVKIEEMI